MKSAERKSSREGRLFQDAKTGGSNAVETIQIRGLELAAAFLVVGGMICLGGEMLRLQGQEPKPLMDRINPNTAPMGSLIRLEGIGRVRANQIIQYRQRYGSETGPVFMRPEDLEKVHGIGPKTVEKIAPYLVLNEPKKPAD
jgi:competence ComEA-like helix-hairpin-helix protein